MAIKTAQEPRKGYKLVACRGSAHSNPHIDNCGLCAPRWGWIEVRASDPYPCEATGCVEGATHVLTDGTHLCAKHEAEYPPLHASLAPDEGGNDA